MGPDAVAIFLGGRLVTRSRDTEFPFRQASAFWYLTGFEHPDAVAVLRTDGGPPFTLYVQPRAPEMEIWTGIRPGKEGAIASYGADEANHVDEFPSHLPNLLAKLRRIYHVLGRDPAIDTRITEVLESMRLRSRQGVAPAEEIVDPRSILHEMRLFKEPAELEIMRRAASITEEAHLDAARMARGGTNEFELQAVIEYAFKRRGASAPAYTTIVGGGRNATVLHYITNDQPLVDGELVLIDAGCELEGYASDVTRTLPIGGRFDGPHRALYEVVLDAQLAGVEASKPGATLGAIHDLTVRRLVEGLVSLRLLAGSVDDLIANETYRRLYMHNTSHWLGLDVHDVGNYRSDGEHRSLEPGMVFTVEPGLYVSANDEQADESFRGIGIRIEDDIVITDSGCENLTASIPKAIDELEALVSLR